MSLFLTFSLGNSNNLYFTGKNIIECDQNSLFDHCLTIIKENMWILRQQGYNWILNFYIEEINIEPFPEFESYDYIFNYKANQNLEYKIFTTIATDKNVLIKIIYKPNLIYLDRKTTEKLLIGNQNNPDIIRDYLIEKSGGKYLVDIFKEICNLEGMFEM